MENSREKLLTLLQKYIWKEKIDDETRVYHDLKITGDDAWELLDKIRQDFGVDLSGMNFLDYFPDKPEAPFDLGRLFGRGAKNKPLTIRHLLQVIEAGHWQEPTVAI